MLVVKTNENISVSLFKVYTSVNVPVNLQNSFCSIKCIQDVFTCGYSLCLCSHNVIIFLIYNK